ncbi:PTS sugar transporter subunit IIA [Liquorilactobacillus vini]|uniref:Ascorbate-specific PTS system EIIA component n=1 Tax=Liquorilactobacillus vini DSM 20605 TaxID=1133569 RepID=A0A0R2CBJ4_9LACO|nr:PTS sugar transporter subunit IIA [Liquorilactobacillus vini]KRM88746.1 multidomain protein [Liquorilactobacillus vini DSM 20605]
MLEKLLNENTVQISNDKDLDWRQAIKLAAQPLLKEGAIETEYITSMIENVENQGPYINIGSKIAMAHARPECGANKISLSFLKTNYTINLLSKDHPINLWFVLSATDNKSHLSLIRDLMNLLTDNEKISYLLNANSKEQLLAGLNLRRKKR